jgi:hypothetical protein
VKVGRCARAATLLARYRWAVIPREWLEEFDAFIPFPEYWLAHRKP